MGVAMVGRGLVYVIADFYTIDDHLVTACPESTTSSHIDTLAP